jgi:hypothetical protein
MFSAGTNAPNIVFVGVLQLTMRSIPLHARLTAPEVDDLQLDLRRQQWQDRGITADKYELGPSYACRREERLCAHDTDAGRACHSSVAGPRLSVHHE